MEPSKEDKQLPLDLSKIPWEDYSDIFKRLKKGTSPVTFVKIITGAALAIGAVLGGTWELAQRLDKKDSPEIVKPPKQQEIGGLLASPVVFEHPDNAVQLEEEKKKVAKLEEEVRNLKSDLSKKPKFVTCIGYENDTTALQKKKDKIELAIQERLNPPITREQVTQGMSYSVEQLNVMTRQAAEYRRMADDTQHQIMGLMELRKACE